MNWIQRWFTDDPEDPDGELEEDKEHLKLIKKTSEDQTKIHISYMDSDHEEFLQSLKNTAMGSSKQLSSLGSLGPLHFQPSWNGSYINYDPEAQRKEKLRSECYLNIYSGELRTKEEVIQSVTTDTPEPNHFIRLPKMDYIDYNAPVLNTTTRCWDVSISSSKNLSLAVKVDESIWEDVIKVQTLKKLGQ